jgi:hypothetical protein
MGDFVIKTGDQIMFQVMPPLVIPPIMAPVPLVGTGMTVLIGGQPVCLLGDEYAPPVKAVLPYVYAAYVGGMGKLTIIVKPANLTKKTVQGKAMLLKGSSFDCIFNVTVPAQMPTPAGPQPDAQVVKKFNAQFITTNTNVQAS